MELVNVVRWYVCSIVYAVEGATITQLNLGIYLEDISLEESM